MNVFISVLLDSDVIICYCLTITVCIVSLYGSGGVIGYLFYDTIFLVKYCENT